MRPDLESAMIDRFPHDPPGKGLATARESVGKSVGTGKIAFANRFACGRTMRAPVAAAEAAPAWRRGGGRVGCPCKG